MGIINIIAITCVLAALLILLIGVVSSIGSYDSAHKLIISATSAVILFAVSIFGSGLLIASVTLGEESETTVSGSVSLVALGNTTKIEGKATGGIFVSQVRIEEKDVYRFMRANDDETYVMDTITTDTPIKEDASPGEARIETTVCKWTDEFVARMAGHCGEQTIIHIPEGSIEREFGIDMGN